MKRPCSWFRTGCGLFTLAACAAAPVFAQTDLAVWTFETSIPVTAGPHSAEGGVNAGAGSPALGFHAGATAYSNPSGNGSVESFSSTNWQVGDYYQFSTSTVGQSDISVSWDQASSNTGPRDFVLQYSTDNTTYTQFGGTLTVLANATPNPTWSAGTPQPVFGFAVDLSSIAALDNDADIYFRLVQSSTVSANGGVVAAGGTNRIDNFKIIAGGSVVATGGCCHGNGFCTVTTAADCVATYSGTYQGDNVGCTGQCAGTPGACCLPNGTCQDLGSEAACIQAGGAYQGLNSNCGTANCPQPTGRCCIGGVCSEITGAACETGGGLYYGDGTVCAGFNCPVLGAPECLIISEVVDGDLAGGNPKFVELTNTGVAPVTFGPTDFVRVYTNGAIVAGASVALDTYSIAAGDSFVIASTANDGQAQFLLAYGFDADLYTPAFFSNGDDVYTLEDGATIIDMHGELGVDGTGTAWEYLDSYSYRNAAANDSNSTFTVAEWTFGGVAALDAADDATRIALLQANTTPGAHDFASGCGGVISGACCYGNGFCTVTTAALCVTQYDGTYQGNGSTCTGQCPGVPGACCLPLGTCSDVANEAACAALGGTYQGLNTTCANTNCPPPLGACCELGVCTDVSQADCTTAGGVWRGAGTSCGTSNCPAAIDVGAAGDIAFGTNRSSALETAQLVRGCALVGHWTDFPASGAFIQSMEYDNAANSPHNARGNLLSMNFGAPPSGPGLLYNVSTDGSDNAQLIFTFDTASGLANTARVTGLSVSPDNTKVAVYNSNSLISGGGTMILLNYTAGSAVGTGSGASATFLQEVPGMGPGVTTGGTTWLDNDTVIFASADPLGTPNSVSVQTKDVGLAPSTFVRTLLTVPPNINFVEVEYAPDISPLVYVMVGSFQATTTNTLFVLDPTMLEPSGPNVGEWVLVGTFDYSTSIQTTREIAMGPDAKLYVAQFNNGIDSIDIATLASNTSVDCYQSSFTSSFSGLDVARTAVGAPSCPGVKGDANCDGSVDFFDIDPFLLALFNLNGYQTAGCGGNPCCGGSICTVDVDCSDNIDFFDIDPFLNCLFSNCLPTPPLCLP